MSMTLGSPSALAIFLFVNRCQIDIGRWTDADDLASRISAAWRILQDVPVLVDDSKTILARVLLGLAIRVRDLGRGDAEPFRIRKPLPLARLRVIAALVILLKEHTSQEQNLAGLSSRVGYSGYHLSHAFAKETGYGYETHLHNMRALAATILLQGTFLTVGEIANRIGYGSSTNFERQFRRRVHMSPTEFRMAAAPRW